MKISELRELNEVELLKKLKDFRSELLNLRLRKGGGNVEKPHMFAVLRKDIARIETLLREKSKNNSAA